MDYAIRKDEPAAITATSTAAEIALYEKWERSNRLSIMFIMSKIPLGMRGSVEQPEKVKDLIKLIDEQFDTSDKPLYNNLIHKNLLVSKELENISQRRWTFLLN